MNAYKVLKAGKDAIVTRNGEEIGRIPLRDVISVNTDAGHVFVKVANMADEMIVELVVDGKIS